MERQAVGADVGRVGEVLLRRPPEDQGLSHKEIPRRSKGRQSSLSHNHIERFLLSSTTFNSGIPVARPRYRTIALPSALPEFVAASPCVVDDGRQERRGRRGGGDAHRRRLEADAGAVRGDDFHSEGGRATCRGQDNDSHLNFHEFM